MDGNASPGNDKYRTRNEISNDLQRKAKYEAELTAGCGYGKKKQKTIHHFWTIIWPALEKGLGWKKVRIFYCNCLSSAVCTGPKAVVMGY